MGLRRKQVEGAFPGVGGGRKHARLSWEYEMLVSVRRGNRFKGLKKTDLM